MCRFQSMCNVLRQYLLSTLFQILSGARSYSRKGGLQGNLVQVVYCIDGYRYFCEIVKTEFYTQFHTRRYTHALAESTKIRQS